MRGVIFPAVRMGQSFILAVCTVASGCLSLLSISECFKLLVVVPGVSDIKGDPLEEDSDSEKSDSLGYGCGEVSAEFEP